MFFIVHIKSSLILGTFSPHEYIVLSSAKLQISYFSTKKKMSLMNIFNDADNIERCSKPQQISDYFLREEPISKGKLRLPIFNPYISNFAISPAVALFEGTLFTTFPTVASETH